MAGRQDLDAAHATNDKLRRHMRILVDLGRLATQKLDLEGLLQQAVVQVARAVEIDHVKIMRYRREKADLLLEAGTGWKHGVVGNARFPIDLRSPPGRAFQTGEPVVIPDTAQAPEFTISPVLQEHGIVSLANVPVLIEGAAWGVLEVDGTAPRDYSAETLNFMHAASTTIGVAIQRAQIAKAETEALAAAAAETHSREVLLAEMQHRVKNNFQIILAMIAIQKRRLHEDAAQRALDHIANRINAISLAHDQLNPSQGLRVVNLAVYLQALCATVEHQLEDIAIDVQADEIDLLIDRAVPLGLVLNEAVTNSVKHAFGGGGGTISVRLTAGVGRGEARLSVSDNGRGIDPSRPRGSGLRLVQSLAMQIGGQVEQHSSERGTTISVQFPIIT
jgi:two-component system, sensor histidine kinase PdtaS